MYKHKEWESKIRNSISGMLPQLESMCVPPKNTKQVVRPEDYGWVCTPYEEAKSKLATRAIQQAIDELASQGGGTVLLSEGDYVSGTIKLASNITLEIAENARLLGSIDLKDYEELIARRRTVMDTHMAMNQSLIFAEGCENICICGKGVIDGRGTQENFPGEETVCGTPGRPFLLRVIDCKNVCVQGVTLKDAACWMQNYLNCENLLLDSIYVENQSNFNNDGIDVDGCRNVIIRNCFVSSGDDALCFKGASQRNNENILVEGCNFYSSCNCIKIGTDTQGDFRRIFIRNCTIGGMTASMRHIKPLGADSGISLEMLDGGTVEDIWIQDITMSDARSPFFIRMDDRGRVRPEEDKPPIGTLRNVIIEEIKGINCGPWGSYFLGYPEKCFENVLLRNVKIEQEASHRPLSTDDDFEEMHNWYPDAHMINEIGDPPAYGLWVRHGINIILEHYEVVTSGQERRPRIVAERNAKIQEITKSEYMD